MKISVDNSPELGGKRKSQILKSRGAMVTFALLLAAVASALIYFLFVGPQFDKVGVGKLYDVATLDAKVTAQEQTLDQLTKLDTSLKSLSDTDIDLVSRVLPNDKLIPELLSQIEVIAQTSGISLASINIADVDDTEQLSTRQQLQKQLAEAVASDKKNKLKTLNIRLSVTAGSYQAFEQFVESLESHARILDIQRFNYGTENQFHSVTVNTYYLES